MLGVLEAWICLKLKTFELGGRPARERGVVVSFCFQTLREVGGFHVPGGAEATRHRNRPPGFRSDSGRGFFRKNAWSGAVQLEEGRDPSQSFLELRPGLLDNRDLALGEGFQRDLHSRHLVEGFFCNDVADLFVRDFVSPFGQRERVLVVRRVPDRHLLARLLLEGRQVPRRQPLLCFHLKQIKFNPSQSLSLSVNQSVSQSSGFVQH